MSDIDTVLKVISDVLFYNLTEDHYSILKWLARKGPMNLHELGRDRRWGKKLLLEGSPRRLGLIPNQFVYEHKVNKKETEYGLTIKGLLATLAEIKFENIYLVKRYEKFLAKIIKKKKLLGWSLDFIKYEIALVMHYNYAIGLDWTRFRNVRENWSQFKTYSDNTIQTFFIDNFRVDKRGTIHMVLDDEYPVRKKRKGQQISIYDIKAKKPFQRTKVYESIKDEYLKLFSILDICTFPVEWGGARKYYEPDQFETDNTFRKYVDRWYLYIDDRNLGQMIRNKLTREDVIQYYDEEFFYGQMDKARRNAKDTLQRNGYDILSK